MNSPVVLSNTRRNLFGIRLNQDQLKTDLNVIWKEQVERQARRWNFDFESLRPLDSEGSVLMHSSPIRMMKRFEWSEVRSLPRQQQQKQQKQRYGQPVKYAMYESEDEEFDQELAVPAFYQHQRVRKMHQEEKSQAQRLKQVRLDTIAKCQSEKTQANVGAKKAKASPKKVTKKTRAQKTATATPGLIITFSENRKDTLRSATVSTGDKKAKTKQPTILNLLKQRKQRATSSTHCGSRGLNKEN